MTSFYGLYPSTSCTGQGFRASKNCFYYNYPFSSTLPENPFCLPAITVMQKKKNNDAFAMQASEPSFADIWDDPREDVWDTL